MELKRKCGLICDFKKFNSASAFSFAISTIALLTWYNLSLI